MVRVAEGRRFAARDVLVMSASIDPTGLRVVRLAVGDESDDARPLAPDEHPSPESSAAFSEWRMRLGASGALPNVYLPDAERLSSPHGHVDLFSGGPVDDASRRYLTLAADARALRVRARVLLWLAARASVDVAGTMRWASLACGPAYPMVAAMAVAMESGVAIEATFVDTCLPAVDVSRRVVLAHGIDPGAHRFTVARAGDAPVPAQSQHLVEALGLLEGLSCDAAARAIAEAFAMVRPGGSLVLSVMLAGRPPRDPELTVAWPMGPMRTLGELAALLASAGVDIADALVHIPQDGVYAVVEVARL